MLRDKPEWQQRAACKDTPRVMFFEWSLTDGHRIRSKDSRHAEVRENLCANCPVRRECLDLAMTEEGPASVNLRFGIFGGLTPMQRVSLYKRGGFACPTCGTLFDPMGLLIGELVCDTCGFECNPTPLPEEGDDWQERHTKIAAHIVSWLIENVPVYHDAPSPSRLASQLGYRKADVVRVYEALQVDNTLVKVDRRYQRMATTAAMRTWRPPHLAA